MAGNADSAMEAFGIIVDKVKLAREFSHLGEYEDALVQYESALALTKDLVNDLPSEATPIRCENCCTTKWVTAVCVCVEPSGSLCRTCSHSLAVSRACAQHLSLLLSSCLA